MKNLFSLTVHTSLYDTQFIDNDEKDFFLRLKYLQYLKCLCEQEYESGMLILEEIQQQIEDYTIKFINIGTGYSLNGKCLVQKMIETNRMLTIGSIVDIYKEKNFNKLYEIVNDFQNAHFQTVHCSYKVQKELILECLYMEDRNVECLQRAEEFLWNAIVQWRDMKTDDQIEEILQEITFYLIYIHTLIKENVNVFSTLKVKKNRLMQSFVHLISLQTSSKYAKREKLININQLLECFVHIITVDFQRNNKTNLELNDYILNLFQNIYNKLCENELKCCDVKQLLIFFFEYLTNESQTILKGNKLLPKLATDLFGYPGRSKLHNVTMNWNQSILLMQLYARNFTESIRIASFEKFHFLERIIAVIPDELRNQFEMAIENVMETGQPIIQFEKCMKHIFFLCGMFIRNESKSEISTIDKGIQYFLWDLMIMPKRVKTYVGLCDLKYKKLELIIQQDKSLT